MDNSFSQGVLSGKRISTPAYIFNEPDADQPISRFRERSTRAANQIADNSNTGGPLNRNKPLFGEADSDRSSNPVVLGNRQSLPADLGKPRVERSSSPFDRRDQPGNNLEASRFVSKLFDNDRNATRELHSAPLNPFTFGKPMTNSNGEIRLPNDRRSNFEPSSPARHANGISRKEERPQNSRGVFDDFPNTSRSLSPAPRQTDQRQYSSSKNSMAMPHFVDLEFVEGIVSDALRGRLGTFLTLSIFLDCLLFGYVMTAGHLETGKILVSRFCLGLLVHRNVIQNFEELPFDFFSFVSIRLLGKSGFGLLSTFLVGALFYLHISSVDTILRYVEAPSTNPTIAFFHNLQLYLTIVMFSYIFFVSKKVNSFQVSRSWFGIFKTPTDYLSSRAKSDVYEFLLLLILAISCSYLFCIWVNFGFSNPDLDALSVYDLLEDERTTLATHNWTDILTGKILMVSGCRFFLSLPYNLFMVYLQWAIYSVEIGRLKKKEENYHEPTCFWLHTSYTIREKRKPQKLNCIAEIHCLNILSNYVSLLTEMIINIETKTKEHRDPVGPENGWMSFAFYTLENLDSILELCREVNEKDIKERERGRSSRQKADDYSDSIDNWLDHLRLTSPERRLASLLLSRKQAILMNIELLVFFFNSLNTTSKQRDFQLNPNHSTLVEKVHVLTQKLNELIPTGQNNLAVRALNKRYSFFSGPNDSLRHMVTTITNYDASLYPSGNN